MGNPAVDIVQQAELGDLLGGLVKSVVAAQDQLDAHASQLATEYVDTPTGTIAIPPLWYTVKEAVVDVQMAASLEDKQFQCRLLNPASVGLYGYDASAGARIRLTIGPSGVTPIKSES